MADKVDDGLLAYTLSGANPSLALKGKGKGD